MRFAPEPFDSPRAQALVRRLEAELAARYGQTARERPTPVQFQAPDGVFVVGEADGADVACGGLRRLEAGVGELKRMFVAPEARGRGAGHALLSNLEQAAREHGYARLRLECGVRQPEALALYERAGFERIEPYGVYADSPLSVCFEKQVATG